MIKKPALFPNLSAHAHGEPIDPIAVNVDRIGNTVLTLVSAVNAMDADMLRNENITTLYKEIRSIKEQITRLDAAAEKPVETRGPEPVQPKPLKHGDLVFGRCADDCPEELKLVWDRDKNVIHTPPERARGLSGEQPVVYIANILDLAKLAKQGKVDFDAMVKCLISGGTLLLVKKDEVGVGIPKDVARFVTRTVPYPWAPVSEELRWLKDAIAAAMEKKQ